MGLFIYLDGKLVPEKNARLSVFDHGLLYGDGVFEGLRIYQGRIFRLQEHLDRLYQSSKGINLEVPLTPEALEQAVVKTVQANKLRDGYIRIVVTRGQGDLGMDPEKCARPSLFIIASKIQLYPQAYYDKGLDMVTVATRRNSPESLNPAIKSLNYLNNILAKIEANNAGALEGLILNQAGYVSECTGENIFVLHKNLLSTPPVSAGVLDGITRRAVLEIGQAKGLDTQERNLTQQDVYVADECFLTGTAAEIVPVTRVDGRKIGTGKPGPITREIRKAFQELTQTEGFSVYEKRGQATF